MPNVMFIKEIQQDTLPVLLPGFSWGSLPAAEILEEEIEGGSPHHSGGDDTEEWHGEDLLGAAKLWVRIRGLLHRLHRLACRGQGAEAPGPCLLTFMMM